ncbi:hypothetical protein DENSPDRAFT_839139 [Dentipellis sp. KUC8613]|nr:hypothetical protein DENSPDRAFT_839139 [Dentipellis sp. KUC8613]
MLRRIFPRVGVLRAILPRVSQPLLPVTSRLMSTAETRTLTRAPRISSFRIFHSSPARFGSPPASPTSSSTEAPNASLTQRLKTLIKSYGWYALGVYAVIAVLDFGVAFVGINLLGAEYVSSVTASIKSYVLSMVSRPPEPGREGIEDTTAPGGNESLYAMLVLAYTVHKTLFLPVRIGLTATLTPRLVGWLRMRGWAGKEGTKRAAAQMRERLREHGERD